MRLELEYREGQWCLDFRGRRLSAPTMEDLREEVEKVLREEGYRGKMELKVHYNWKNLPQWLWQYQSFYFERVWEIKI